MIRVILWLIFIFVIIRLFSNIRVVATRKTTTQPPPQPPPQPQQRPGQPTPFAQIQDAEFEDITPKPEEKQ